MIDSPIHTKTKSRFESMEYLMTFDLLSVSTLKEGHDLYLSIKGRQLSVSRSVYLNDLDSESH